MVSAVLDTNVVVSAHIVPVGRQALLLDLGLQGRFVWFTSDPILNEYEVVLRRSRFRFSAEAVTDSLQRIRAATILVTPSRSIHVSSDAADNKFLECASEAGARYLVTGNLRHFPPGFEGVTVVSPREFSIILATALQTS